MASRLSKVRKLTDEDKQRILELHAAQVPVADIASELKVGTSQVTGFVSTQKYISRQGAAPYAAPADPASPPEAAPSAAPPSPPSDGFTFNRPAPSVAGGGFNFSGQTTKYQVERIHPPEGLMGVHPAPFTLEDLCKQYGEGTYDIIRQEPSKPPVSARHVVSSYWGGPKYPRIATRPGDRRPWDRYAERYQDDPMREAGHRPYYGQQYPYGAAGYERDRAEAARQGAPGGQEVTAEVVRQFGQFTTKIMDQTAQGRQSGPDTFLRDFLATQQEQSDRRAQEERDREDRRRQDEDRRWQRQVDEETKKHDREMERLRQESENRSKAEKEQRDALLALEDKKLEVVREQFRLSEQSLRQDLAKSREEMQSLQAAVKEQLGTVEDRIDEETERSRSVLEREFGLRQKSLENEHALRQQMLDLQKDTAAKTEGELFVRTLDKVVGEAAKTIREAVQLKKIEAMSPEAQAAAISKGVIDGNVRMDEQPAQAQPQAQPQDASRPAGGQDGGAPAEARGGTTSMDEMIQAQLQKPFFRQVLKEWVRQVEHNVDATTFATMYMEWAKDPEDHQGRKMTTAFANYMRTRRWPEMLQTLRPHLDQRQNAVLAKPEAETFYETFAYLVVESIQDYWEQFAAARRAVAEQRRAGNGKPAEGEPGREKEQPQHEPAA